MKWLKKVTTTPLTSIAKVIDSIEESTNDRANAPSIHAVRESINNNWLSIYPVGSIYMSVNNVDPSLVFGGTWSQIKDKFLLACGDTYNNGATGGSATHTPSGTVGNHTLTVNEMPAHTHNVTAGGDYIITSYGVVKDVQGYTSGDVYQGGDGATTNLDVSSTGGGQGHNHSFTGTAGDYMPPYIAVNVWVRTA